MTEPSKKPANRRIIWPVALFVVVMFGFGFALVPLYDVFCELTGLNGKVKSEAVAEASFKPDLSRTVSVEFLTTVNGAMPLRFRSEVKKLKVHPGEYHTVKFFGTNTSDSALVGRAIPSIAPGWQPGFSKKCNVFALTSRPLVRMRSVRWMSGL